MQPYWRKTVKEIYSKKEQMKNIEIMKKIVKKTEIVERIEKVEKDIVNKIQILRK